MADKETEFKELFRKLYKEKGYHLATDYYRMSAELTIAGYQVEHGWGHYLHCPDGRTVVLDDWAEKNE